MKNEYMTMEQAAAWVGPRRAGKPTHRETVRAWCTTGLQGLILRSEQRGAVLFTKVEWMEAFFEGLTRRRTEAAEQSRASKGLTAADRAKQRKARQRLEELGAI